MSTDINLPPPTDGISSVSFSPDSSRLLVSSWDGSLYVHNVADLASGPKQPQSMQSGAAILTSAWSSTTSNAYSAGLDTRVREWDLERGESRVLGRHDAAVGSLVWCPETNTVISGSWDSTISVWDPRASNPLVARQSLPAKAYCLAFAPASSSLVVSMAHRNVYVYDVRKMEAPTQKRESALKFMTRSVACMVDGKGWASGSIEGRIAVEYFDPDPSVQAQKYAFRCHRQTINDVDCVYPINALAYHPIHNTFASGGSDGTISVWDHTAKKRMKQYSHLPTEVSGLAFSQDGTKLAIACSYEQDNGIDEQEMSKRDTIALIIKEGVMDDCRPKAKAT